MKKSQQYVIIVGLIVFLIISLFPPITGINRSKENIIKTDMGYHFLFMRPTAEDVYLKLFDKPHFWPGDDEKLKEINLVTKSIHCYSVIDYKLYLFQYFVLINVAALLFLYFKHRK